MSEPIPTFFPDKATFRQWLLQNHEKESELTVGFYKVSTKKPSLSWGQSVDEALCFGWIDGVRKSIDEESYQIRFSKRKPNSIWSAVNISKIEELIKLNLMYPAGLKSFEKRRERNSKVYSYEQKEVVFSREFEQLFETNNVAWKYFCELAPSYKKVSTNWVMSAKLEETRIKRLAQLISESENGTNQWKDNKYKKNQ